jgi:NAD(P)-dependent dehydrogenase (short-subunit alcohol dehydrogenase family)
MRLAGKVAIITGAGSGIGRATAGLFAREGAAVAAVDRDGRTAVSAAEDARRDGPAAIGIEADVCVPADVAAVVARVRAEFGRIDILCNNAGIPLVRPFMDTTVADVDRLLGVNFTSVLLCSQAVVPSMLEAGGGVIVNVASNAGLVGRPWQSVYGASKAAAISLTKSMALALAPQIRVNCVCPGSVDTPMFRSAMEKTGRFDLEWRRTELVTPLRRIGRPEDIARAMLFLASTESDFITGIALPVDGGRTAGIAESGHLGMDVDDKER